MYAVFVDKEENMVIKEVVIRIVEYREKLEDENTIYRVKLITNRGSYYTEDRSKIYIYQSSSKGEIDVTNWKTSHPFVY